MSHKLVVPPSLSHFQSTEMDVALGLSVPPYTQHAISVSLPTWRDNVGYEEGEKRVVDSTKVFYSFEHQKSEL